MVPLHTLEWPASMLQNFSGTWPIPKKSFLLQNAALPWLPWPMTGRLSLSEIAGSETPAAGRTGKSPLIPNHSLPALEVRQTAFSIVLQGEMSCWRLWGLHFNADNFSPSKQYIVKFGLGDGEEIRGTCNALLHVDFFQWAVSLCIAHVMAKWRWLIFQRKNCIYTTVGCSSLMFWY